FAGLVLSFVGLYLIAEAAVGAGIELIHADELSRATTPEQYRAVLDRRAKPLALFLSVVGAFIAATLCGLYAANAAVARARAGPVSRWLTERARAKDDGPLTPDEFERVRQCCLFVNLHGRSA